MARHLVCSFVLVAALWSVANAGPCRPSTSLADVATTTIGTAFSLLPTTETSQAKFTTITDTTVAADTSNEKPTVTEGQTQTASTSAASDAASTIAAKVQDTTTELGTTTTTQDISVETTSETSTIGAEDCATATEASTTSPAPAPSCVDNLKVPTPENVFCAVKGYEIVDGSTLVLLASGPGANRLECYRRCVETPNCQTFVVDRERYCDLYQGAIVGTDGSDTSYKWYEPSCFCDVDSM